MAFLTDTFTDTSALTLSSHTGETGATWAEHTSYTAGEWKISAANRAMCTTVPCLVYASGAPAGAEYDIEFVMYKANGSTCVAGAAFRIDTGADTYYRVTYGSSNDTWRITKVVAGTVTNLELYVDSFANGTARTVLIECRDGSKTVYLDSVQRMQTFDNAITGAGLVGLINTSGATADGNRLHIDSITATDFVSVATHLVFDEQPTDAPFDTVIAPPVTVFALNDSEEIDTDYTGDVTIVLQSGTGTLSGSTTVAAIGGVATFDDLAINTVGTGKVLRATASGLTLADSAAFEILNQLATIASFVQQPTNEREDTNIAPAITVEALKPDLARDTAYTGDISLALGNNPVGGSMAGTVTVAAIAGLATFSAAQVTKPGTGYTLLAQGNGLAEDESVAFNITLKPATHLFFYVQPSEVDVDASVVPPVVVYARNSENVLDTSFGGDVTIALNDNPGGATLSGSTTVTADNGVATFDDLSLDEPGDGYTLIASEA